LEFHHRNDQSIKSLVEIAQLGHYPMFEPEWLLEILQDKKKLTGNEKAKAKTLFKSLVKHRSIDRKKTVIHSMDINDRTILVKAFMKMVENKVLDNRPELQ
tara:strand:- start:356768 stop:357070 length:303 start_codon:yes stop_codon:yes gene_type:complete